MKKKETLEDAAEKFLIRQGCQRMDCDGENCNFFEDVQPKDLIEFAKWQQEKMYSEEDLREAFKFGFSNGFASDVLSTEKLQKEKERLFCEWFEQSKKK